MTKPFDDNDRKITSARITPLPRPMPDGFMDPMPEVWVTTPVLGEQLLFWYYPDEIRFTPEEFIGLTIDEAYALRRKKDIDYLQAP